MTNVIAITKTIFISASKAQVWRFLTEKEKLAKWFHHAESNLVEGEEYRLLSDGSSGEQSKLCWGRVLRADYPNKLQYSFTIKPMAGAMTTVTWLLEDVFGGTRVTLIHDGIGDAVGDDAALGLFMALDTGWDGHLACLRQITKEIKD